MALWQFGLALVPDEVLALRGGGGLVDVDTLAAIWSGAQERCDVVERFGCVLPLKAGGDGSSRFGDEDRHDALVGIEGGRVVDVSIRLDLRGPWRGVLGDFCRLARELNCSFVDPDGRVLPPTMSVMEAEVLGSRAARFVKDPHGFLRALDAERRRPSDPE